MPRTLISLLLLTALCLTTVAQRRTLSVSQQKDPPILIESIDLAGRILQPGVEFNAPAGWTESLNIRVKNNTEERITFIEMLLVVTEPNNREVAAMNSDFMFGNLQGTVSLAPGESASLSHVGTYGDNNVPGNARLMTTSVLWNGDDSLKFDGGDIRRKVQGGSGTEDPPIYRALGLTAKYRYPSWFSPNMKVVKAASTVVWDTWCNQKFESEDFKYCDIWCWGGNQYHCWVPRSTFDPSPDPGQILDSLSLAISWKCRSGFCTNFDCGGSTGYGSSVTADYECNPIQSPIIKDGGAKGIPLTDVEHGVVYDVLGNRSAHLASWPVPGTEDSFLVRDINKNGLIDSFREMFGNSTEQVASYNPNGFRALAMLDSNVDGQVTAQDSKYGELQWWTDRNHDGISQSGELSRVTESLSTTYKLSRKVDEYGNQFRYRAKVGYNSWMWDVFLVLRP